VKENAQELTQPTSNMLSVPTKVLGHSCGLFLHCEPSRRPVLDGTLVVGNLVVGHAFLKLLMPLAMSPISRNLAAAEHQKHDHSTSSSAKSKMNP